MLPALTCVWHEGCVNGSEKRQCPPECLRVAWQQGINMKKNISIFFLAFTAAALLLTGASTARAQKGGAGKGSIGSKGSSVTKNIPLAAKKSPSVIDLGKKGAIIDSGKKSGTVLDSGKKGSTVLDSSKKGNNTIFDNAKNGSTHYLGKDGKSLIKNDLYCKPNCNPYCHTPCSWWGCWCSWGGYNCQYPGWHSCYSWCNPGYGYGWVSPVIVESTVVVETPAYIPGMPTLPTTPISPAIDVN